MRRSDLAGRAVWDSRRTTDGRLGSRVNKRRLSHPLVNPQFTASLQGLPLARSGLSGGLCELELGLGHADTEYAAPPASPPYGGGSASGNDGSSDGSGDGSGSSIGRVGSGSSTVSRGSGSADGDDGGGAGGDDVVMRPRKNSKTLPLAKMPTLIDASPSAELGEAAGRQFYGRQESLLADETLKRDGSRDADPSTLSTCAATPSSPQVARSSSLVLTADFTRVVGGF
ncbi:hypothetical protein EMIHUDRAFT_441589 [Emiliania huxleyi CCMP1516]|uniref:Uncharacterized protein n=3 Tax=Emiliania huxleyi TaxID=2903 RepID=A0A0D3KCN2_EMIH1|nr:hypothetical protein EMIHUDRAFT_441589 [Emiliania huxleyi CCMP1516]EOD33517.1 hypothetical protein EMIHUDRAFT_441589 [Emiliania huxleyi CCMP1516]|mmetsp:Transcript_38711/g.124221  ORF Transcript_38711/g.124221 Transcript_38711/m.124221 type:complete len:228 (+) Transcript_38711:46-729(+)|eukprot:XP_005785946.1 hypothetical protein EMIHUDRAFT_441589 [Emiliania huxleyi CCMP1516]